MWSYEYKHIKNLTKIGPFPVNMSIMLSEYGSMSFIYVPTFLKLCYLMCKYV